MSDQLQAGPNSYHPITPQIVAELGDIVGPANVLYGEPERMIDYGHDEVAGEEFAHMPDVVVKPATADEIAAIMRLANRERIPVTPRGAGSGLSGGAVPVYGGILLSVERMNRILEIDRQNMVVVVEPGVITNDINEAIREFGLFYAGYPMSQETCFVGGNVAENAGGGRAIKYGVTGQYVLGLEVVLPSGDIVRLGGKRVKDVTGYDLIHLLVGSEGTLGIFTQAILKLIPLPAARMVLLIPFADVPSAVAAVPQIMADPHLRGVHGPPLCGDDLPVPGGAAPPPGHRRHAAHRDGRPQCGAGRGHVRADRRPVLGAGCA
jgi:glycolate oxidase